jgi:hypothetical protein
MNNFKMAFLSDIVNLPRSMSEYSNPSPYQLVICKMLIVQKLGPLR